MTFIIIFAVCMLAGLFVCTRKQAMHEDEFYSYYSSNRHVGLIAEGEVTAREILDELEVLPGEGFRFGLVREVQSWDVHPPVYYFLLHFVCSLFPGKFSPWFGLGLNLTCFAAALILMKKLGQLLMPDAPLITDLGILAWGISAGTLGGLVFIRMYMLLTLWILAATIFHLRLLDACHNSKEYPEEKGSSVTDRNLNDTKKKPVIQAAMALFVITFLGFMTHYYFLIWLLLIGGVVNVLMIVRTRRIRPTLIYTGVGILCALACYLFYPAFPAQMFRGQRGAQATDSFFDMSNTSERLNFFASRINHIGFGGLLWVVLGVVVVVSILYWDRRRGLRPKLATWRPIEESRLWDEFGRNVLDRPVKKLDVAAKDRLFTLTAALVGYYLLVSKTALMLGDSSIRYHMPVLGVAYMTLGYALYVAMGCTDKKPLYILTIAIQVALIVANILCCARGGIPFLYPETEEKLAALEKYPDARVLYIYPEGQSWIMWAEATQLLRFEEVYYTDALTFIRECDDPVVRDYILSEGDLIVYVDVGLDPETITDLISEVRGGQAVCERLFEDDYTVTVHISDD